MSYALGQAPEPRSGRIKLGRGARKDPILSLSSMLASGIMREVSVVPAPDRERALRQKLNRLYPGLADKALTKAAELRRRGRNPNQAMFDGLRLALANRIAEYVDAQLPSHSAAGLGDTASDVRLAFCMGAGTSAAAGGWVGAFTDATSSATITTAAQAGAGIMGCNQEQLAAQARIAEANAAAAQANALAMSQPATDDKTMLYVALGGGALVLVLLGVVVLKK